MSSASKVKCPKCSRQVLKKVMVVTNGKCNNCGYKMISAITNFVTSPKNELYARFNV